MRFNSAELTAFAGPAGDHEGRLTHKPPPKTLYDSAFKERWFKLRGNLLFYYRLNEFGGVEKNEPTGVFVLENCEVNREADADVPFGFAIQWKDDPDRKHMFFAQNDQSVYNWVTKIVQASYEHMRAKLITLRVQIRRKSGKDPLENFGTPLPQRASWSQDIQHAHSMEALNISSQQPRALSVPPRLTQSTREKPSLPQKSPRLFKRSPVPPPRREKKSLKENGFSDGSGERISKNKASFKCHISGTDEVSSKTSDNKIIPHKSSFRSHIND